MSKFLKSLATVLPLGAALVLTSTPMAYAADETAPTSVENSQPNPVELSEEPKPTECGEPNELDLHPIDLVIEQPDPDVDPIDPDLEVNPEIYTMNAAGAPMVQRKNLQLDSSKSFEPASSHHSNLLDFFKRKKKVRKL